MALLPKEHYECFPNSLEVFFFVKALQKCHGVDMMSDLEKSIVDRNYMTLQNIVLDGTTVKKKKKGKKRPSSHFLCYLLAILATYSKPYTSPNAPAPLLFRGYPKL